MLEEEQKRNIEHSKDNDENGLKGETNKKLGFTLPIINIDSEKYYPSNEQLLSMGVYLWDASTVLCISVCEHM